jgi:hypothetical protein
MIIFDGMILKLLSLIIMLALGCLILLIVFGYALVISAESVPIGSLKLSKVILVVRIILFDAAGVTGAKVGAGPIGLTLLFGLNHL